MRRIKNEDENKNRVEDKKDQAEREERVENKRKKEDKMSHAKMQLTVDKNKVKTRRR